MDDSLKHQQKAEEAGMDPEKVDFALNEKELEDVSGGAPANCGEVGQLSVGCTKTGV